MAGGAKSESVNHFRASLPSIRSMAALPPWAPTIGSVAQVGTPETEARSNHRVRVSRHGSISIEPSAIAAALHGRTRAPRPLPSSSEFARTLRGGFADPAVVPWTAPAQMDATFAAARDPALCYAADAEDDEDHVEVQDAVEADDEITTTARAIAALVHKVSAASATSSASRLRTLVEHTTADLVDHMPGGRGWWALRGDAPADEASDHPRAVEGGDDGTLPPAPEPARIGGERTAGGELTHSAVAAALELRVRLVEQEYTARLADVVKQSEQWQAAHFAELEQHRARKTAFHLAQIAAIYTRVARRALGAHFAAWGGVTARAAAQRRAVLQQQFAHQKRRQSFVVAALATERGRAARRNQIGRVVRRRQRRGDLRVALAKWAQRAAHARTVRHATALIARRTAQRSRSSALAAWRGGVRAAARARVAHASAVRLFMRRDRRLVRAALRTWRGAHTVAAAKVFDHATPAPSLAALRAATSVDAVNDLVLAMDGASAEGSAPVAMAVAAKLTGFITALQREVHAARAAHSSGVQLLSAAVHSARANEERATASIADAHAAQIRERLAAQAATHAAAQAEHASRAASAEAALRAEMDARAEAHDDAVHALKAAPARAAAQMLAHSDSGVGSDGVERLARPFKLRIVGGAAREAGAPLSSPWRAALVAAFASALDLPSGRLRLSRAVKSGARTVGACGTLHDVVDVVLWIQPPLLDGRAGAGAAAPESACRPTADVETRLVALSQDRTSAVVAKCGVQRGGRRVDADLWCDAGAQFRCAAARETQLAARQQVALATALRDGAAQQKVAFTWWQKARVLEAAASAKEVADTRARTLRVVADLKSRAATAALLAAGESGRAGAATEAKVIESGDAATVLPGGGRSAARTAKAAPLAHTRSSAARTVARKETTCVHLSLA